MRTFFLSFFCVFSLNSSIYAQQDTSSINRGRLAITGGSALAVLGGSYAYIQNSWWSDQSSSFHFDDGSDLRYAKNIDKGGHFFGGILVADLFQSSLKWSGVNEKKSYFEIVFATIVRVGDQIKEKKDLEKIINDALKTSEKTVLVVIYNNQNQRRYIGVKLD